MKFNQGLANEICKWIVFVLIFVVFGGGFFLFGAWMICMGNLGMGLLFLIHALLWCYVMAGAFHSMAAVTLSGEGVYFRVYIKTKFYAWDQIVQAGVLWSQKNMDIITIWYCFPIRGLPVRIKIRTLHEETDLN